MNLMTWLGDMAEVVGLRCRLLYVTTERDTALDRAATAEGEIERLKRTLMSVDRSVERSQQHLLRRVEVQDRELERLRERLCEAASEGESHE